MTNEFFLNYKRIRRRIKECLTWSCSAFENSKPVLDNSSMVCSQTDIEVRKMLLSNDTHSVRRIYHYFDTEVDKWLKLKLKKSF